ncbi:FtsX-like permease family protein [Nocardioides sp. dk4132]|uniref:FtsX-like permease family protein n=1 Tax=unclassified Nocardioides TaxID=2615069 RepID=UPI001295488B|nr:MULTISPECIES: ABC transporter permease [unclassified Nocardioides]MQW78053.1 FtsX-like permease family protein [Nocardioides sp. dk4132]QGA08156.1 FtsX-like permease family protein [Nocardioides sp. dk884]
MWPLARSGARAHVPSLVAPFLVLALAAVLVSGTGVLVESGLRSPGEAEFLVALALSFAGTALLLVVFVVSATVSLALQQRQRDFALLRAVGATRSQVRGLVAREVGLVAVIATPIGAVAGLLGVRALTPQLRDAGMVEPGFAMSLSPLPVLAAVLFLLPVSYLAARVATRGTLRASPTAAVTQSVVEPTGIGRTRRTAAVVVAALGLASALSPAIVPGALGSATAAVSAFLLIGAAALAGPALVEWLVQRTGVRHGGAATQLALTNSRGFARRLTTVVVPLALALGVGTVQATLDDTLAAAGARELEDGLHADLIVTGTDLDADRLAAIAAVPGVEVTTPLASVPVQVRTDDEGEWLGSLAWEPTQMRTLPAGDVEETFDPQVSDGTLADLEREDTIAISRDARLETGKGMGERIALRWDGGDLTWATVVAVYDRGLGFGGYLVGQGTPAAHGLDVAPDTVLLRTSDPAARAAVADLGLSVTDEEQYVAAAGAASDEARDLSTLLLLLLLVFVAVAAANALVLATAGRRAELLLLWRTGATRRQLVTMAGVEALLIGLVAWLVGTATVVPAVIGASVGLLGLAVPPLALTTYAALSAAVLLIPLLTVVPVVARIALARQEPALA